MKKILIADSMHESISSMLEQAGFAADYLPNITRQEIIQTIGQYDGLIIRSKTNVDKELIDLGEKLTFVARAGAGIDKVDYPYLTSKKIPLINAPEGNRDAVGEHTIGVLLSILHRINQANEEVKNNLWDREGNRGWELKDRTVGIFGYGYMGSSLAQKLSGFGCKVIAYDKYKSNFGDKYAEEVNLERFFLETEILSIHVPLTDETNQIFDRTLLAKFAKLKVVLNTARGEVLSLAALLELLQTDQLFGVGLDVLENEKILALTQSQQLIFNELKAMNNVILTPHVAGWTFESYERINRVIVDKLKDLGLS